jgi:hypothetical protein
VDVEVTQITKNVISRELLGGHIVHIVMNCVTRLIQAEQQEKFGLGADNLQFFPASLTAPNYIPSSNLEYFPEQQLR